MRTNRWLYILPFLIAIIAFAQTSITSSVDKNEITIGDRVRYSIQIEYPEDGILVTPSIGANLGMFEIQDFNVDDPVKHAEGTLLQEIEYTISTFTTGEYVIPPIGIIIAHESGRNDTLITQPINVNVKSLLEGRSPEELDIRGIKAPLQYPKDNRWIWYLTASLLLIAAIILFILYYFKRKREGLSLFDFVSPPKPAHVLALERLEQIRDLRYSRFDEAKLYFTDLSEILREYIENRYKIDALEMTTMETIEGLRQGTTLSTKFIADVQSVLFESDMVKFAHLLPEKELGRTLWKIVYDFVISTKPIEDYGDQISSDDEQKPESDEENERQGQEL